MPPGAAPRAQVQLVDGHRRTEGLAGAPGGHPLGVVPLVVEVGDDRRVARRALAGERVRVGLVDRRAVRGDDPELVAVAGSEAPIGPGPDPGGHPLERAPSGPTRWRRSPPRRHRVRCPDGAPGAAACVRGARRSCGAPRTGDPRGRGGRRSRSARDRAPECRERRERGRDVGIARRAPRTIAAGSGTSCGAAPRSCRARSAARVRARGPRASPGRARRVRRRAVRARRGGRRAAWPGRCRGRRRRV